MIDLSQRRLINILVVDEVAAILCESGCDAFEGSSELLDLETIPFQKGFGRSETT